MAASAVVAAPRDTDAAAQAKGTHKQEEYSRTGTGTYWRVTLSYMVFGEVSCFYAAWVVAVLFCLLVIVCVSWVVPDLYCVVRATQWFVTCA